VTSCPRSNQEEKNKRTKKEKKKPEDQRPETKSELLTECSSEALKGERQGFGNMTAAKLRYYCNAARCGKFVYVNRGFYEH
jgi:hypothetical protein